MTILKNTFYLGYKFSQTWPKKEPYLHMFEQTKAIRLADLSMTVAPAIALVTVWLQIYYLGMESLQTALAMSLLILSIPAHGYYQLGQQANRRLPISLQYWYREIEHKIIAQQKVQESYDDSKVTSRYVISRKSNSRLTFMDLALILNQLFKQ